MPLGRAIVTSAEVLACHAVVRSAGDGFWIWAESPEAPAPTPGVPTAGGGIAAHPFAAHGGSLREVLDFLGLSASSSVGARVELATLLLPSTGTGIRCRPLPSACVLNVTANRRRPVAAAAAKPAMRRWSVPALALSPAAAADLALALAQASTYVRGKARGRAVAGNSLSWVAAVTELALELLARGRVLPAVVGNDGPLAPPLVTGSTRGSTSGTTARWLPMPTPEDLARMAKLAEAMPPVCRGAVEIAPGGATAAAATSRTGPVGASANPSVLLVRVLCALVDDAAHRALANCRLAPPRRGRRPALLPVGEALLEVLAGPPPAGLPQAGLPRPSLLMAAPSAVAEVAAMLDHWRRPAAGSASPLRTCFRLTPPSLDEEATADLSPAPARGTAAPARNKRTTTTATRTAAAAAARAAPAPAGWSLEFLLQPVSDPSLLVPAGEVWRSGPALASLGTGGEDPREKLLADLGHASRLLPELDAALEEARPDALALSTEGAYRFLSEAAPVLEQAGFGVLVPPWWRSRGARLGLRVKAAPKTAEVTADNGLGLDGLCDYRYEVALGDAVLTEAELRELARLKAPLVRTKGRWVELRREDLEAALDLLKRQRTSPLPPLSALDLVRLGLGLAPAELPVVAMEATGWLGELLERGRGRLRGPPHAGRFLRRTAPLPATRPWMARMVGPLRPGRMPGRRHGSRQNGTTPRPLAIGKGERQRSGRRTEAGAPVPDRREGAPRQNCSVSMRARPDAPCLPDVGGGQLAARSGPFCPVGTRLRSPRSGASHRRRFCQGRGGGRTGRHDLQLAGP